MMFITAREHRLDQHQDFLATRVGKTLPRRNHLLQFIVTGHQRKSFQAARMQCICSAAYPAFGATYKLQSFDAKSGAGSNLVAPIVLQMEILPSSLACVPAQALPELLSKRDNDALGSADVGETVRFLVLHFAD
jgi:hypothetical protein